MVRAHALMESVSANLHEFLHSIDTEWYCSPVPPPPDVLREIPRSGIPYGGTQTAAMDEFQAEATGGAVCRFPFQGRESAGSRKMALCGTWRLQRIPGDWEGCQKSGKATRPVGKARR